MKIKGKAIYLILVLIIWVMPLSAQNNGGAANPFDLNYRLDKEQTEQIAAVVEIEETVGNPFDVAKPAAILKEQQQEEAGKKKDEPLIRIQREPEDNDVPKAWLLLTFLPVILLLTLVAGVYRDKLNMLYRSIINGNFLNLAYRDSKGRANPHRLLLFVVAILSFGLLGLMMALGDYVSKENYLLALVSALAMSTGYMLFKYVGIWSVANIFPNQKEMGRYLFVFGQFNHALGMVALAFGVFFAFAPHNAVPALQIAGGIVLALWLLLRIFRGAQIGGEFLVRNIFRFFAYLCTVELAPIIIVAALVKRILNL